MALPNKYKGKSFAQVAQEIEKKYQDRYDPISLNGLNSEIEALKQAQELQRQQLQQQNQTIAPEVSTNEGMGFNPNIQPESGQYTSNRGQSNVYDSKFAHGGVIDPTNPDKQRYDESHYSGRKAVTLSNGKTIYIDMPKSSKDYYSEQNIFSPHYDIGAESQPQDIFNRRSAFMSLDSGTNPPSSDFKKFPKLENLYFNPEVQQEYADGGYLGLALQTAPLLMNAYQLANLEKADLTPRRTVDTGQFLNQLQQFRPRQSRFQDVDFGDIERGLTEGSARFTQQNLSASRGNTGAFVANELANQNQLLNAISQARMNQQVQNRQTDVLNAQEQARIDSMLQQQGSQSAQLGLRGAMFNAQQETQADTADAANLAAYESAKANLQSDLTTNIATIGKGVFDNARLSNMFGYDILGNYKAGDEKEKEGIVDQLADVLGISKKESKKMLETDSDEFNITDEEKEEILTRFRTSESKHGGKLSKGKKSKVNYAYGGSFSSVLKNLKKK